MDTATAERFLERLPDDLKATAEEFVAELVTEFRKDRSAAVVLVADALFELGSELTSVDPNWTHDEHGNPYCPDYDPSELTDGIMAPGGAA